MYPESVFSVCNTSALVGWIVLTAGFRKPWSVKIARWLAAGFAGFYCLVLATHFAGAEGGFGSLSEVMKLFANPWVTLAGWVHYLAFDLFTGAWIVARGQREELAWWRVVPALPLTFLFGPAGLLLFALLRGRLF